jgi:hypothetical protein
MSLLEGLLNPPSQPGRPALRVAPAWPAISPSHAPDEDSGRTAGAAVPAIPSSPAPRGILFAARRRLHGEC